jgi:hypothetical protein
MIRILILNLFFILTVSVEAKEVKSLQTEYVKVLFDASLKSAADETLYLYPIVKENIESLFHWNLNLKPSILLVKTREGFVKIAGDSLVVAFAIPEKNLIVIDYVLPRWLDEGLCQWASDGIGEIIRDPKSSQLNRAAFLRRFIRLQELERRFPPDKSARLLAYEESKSFITYLVGRFGKEIIFQVLNQMKKGETAEEAIQTASSISFEMLEKEWHHSLRKKTTWFTFLSYYLYEILFTLMAFITVIAFIKLRLKKKSYVDDDLEDL